MGIRAGSCTVQHGLSNVTYEAYRRCLNGQKAAALHACLCPRDLAVTPSTPPPPVLACDTAPLRFGGAWLVAAQAPLPKSGILCHRSVNSWFFLRL